MRGRRLRAGAGGSGEERKVSHYFFSYPALKFGVFDVGERRVRRNVFVNSIPHISALDDAGRCWGTWGQGHKWFCFDPQSDDVVFFDKAMDSAVRGADVMCRGAGPVDSMVNGGDGFLYVGTALGELYRLEPETAETIYLLIARSEVVANLARKGKPRWQDARKRSKSGPDPLADMEVSI